MMQETDNHDSMHCQACGFLVTGKRPRFCPECGAVFGNGDDSTSEARTTKTDWNELDETEAISIQDVPIPKKENVQFTIGPYQVLETIGKGGMGEVYLVYDSVCGRKIALKRIRADLKSHKKLHHRFSREARITSQLTHPAVIPIYNIHSDENLFYYTMPFVEGRTLKEILRQTRKQEQKNEELDHVGGSIPALIRIFLSICEAISYAHSRGVLHRDLKPENVIVGKFGETTILDWGLAKLLREPADVDEEDLPTDTSPDLTRPGKVVGTISYMAPERAKEAPASIQTEVYALGITLYQILTLQQPFRRGKLEEFRKSVDSEKLPEPCEVAPYRDVPPVLSQIVKRCLAADPKERYRDLPQLIHDLKNYIEGRSEWFVMSHLDLKRKEDWEFQEHVLITEHLAVVRDHEATNWVSLMVSRASFPESIQIKARIRIDTEGHGLGFLFSIPEGSQRTCLSEGYCLWLGTDKDPSTQLSRSNVIVIDQPDTILQRDRWYDVRIEKVDNHISLYLNNVLQFSYVSYLPLKGTHIGLLAKDGEFHIEDLNVSVGNLNITVSCLAVPDAFLASGQFNHALEEYRRIGNSFSGRAEGREALFRAGVTLVQEAKAEQEPEKASALFDRALEEFVKLHHTPGAPLEYLGKSLVYRAQHDYDQEINGLELGYRRYHKHPLSAVLEEQILYRMHDSSRLSRPATYRFILVAAQLIPRVANARNSIRLFSNLCKHWEKLPFLEELSDSKLEFGTGSPIGKWNFIIQLAFWLKKPYTIKEVLEEVLARKKPDRLTLQNGMIALLQMGSDSLVEKLNERISQKDILLPTGLTEGDHFQPRVWTALGRARREGNLDFLLSTCQKLRKETYKGIAPILDIFEIWASLLKSDWERAENLLHHYPSSKLSTEGSPLRFLYGCWLRATKGEDAALAHLAGASDYVFPRSCALLGSFLTHKIDLEGEWFSQAFSWEKQQLYRQLTLYYHCSGDQTQKCYYEELELKELHDEG